MQKFKNKKGFLRVNYKKKKLYTKKDRQNFYHFRNLKRKLNIKIKNKELFKIPKFINYYFSLKLWKKPRLKKWKRFFSFRHKYFNKYYAKISEWKDFKYFKREFYFWFQRRTKRQLYVRKKEFILLKKINKIKNYYNLKKKYFLKKEYFESLKRRYFSIFNKLKEKYFLYIYLNIILSKKIKLIKKMFIISSKSLYIIYGLLYKFIYFFKKLRFFLRKVIRKKYSYIDFIDLKELKYIRSKWIQRIKRRRKYIYKNFKFEKKAKFFFGLKRKIFFFLSLFDLKNQFYYLKVRTVDTNFYITLTNFKHEVVIYRSTGQVSENRKKKIKLSPFTINNMIFDIIRKIKSLKIKYMIVQINSKINKNIKNVFRTIGSSVNTKLVKAEFSKPIPHHFGTRKPKPRRL